MIKKVIKVGSSAAITLSKEVLRDLGVSIGDEIEAKSDPTTHMLVVEPKTKIRPEVIQWTNQFIEENRDLLEELSDR